MGFGSMLGSIAGGAIGSIVPGVGTAAGMAIGGGLGGAFDSQSNSNQAASQASAAQAEASRRGIELQQQQYNDASRYLSPYIQGATGIGPAPRSVPEKIISWYNQYTGQAPDAATLGKWVADISGGKKNIGDAELTIANGELAQAYALQAQQEAANMPPGSFQVMQGILGLLGPEAQQQAMMEFEQSPMLAGLNREQERGILANASATGGLRGGDVNSMIAENRSSNMYGLLRDRLSDLTGMTNYGMAATGQQIDAGSRYAGNVGGYQGQIGAAQAGEAMARGQANNEFMQGIGQVLPTAIKGIGGLFGGAGSPGTTIAEGAVAPWSGKPWAGGTF